MPIFNKNKPPFLFKKIEKLLRSNWQSGSLEIQCPNGEIYSYIGENETQQAILQIKDYRFLKRVLNAGDIGFFEGYRLGEWDSPDLNALLQVFCMNLDAINRLAFGGGIVQKFNTFLHKLNENSKKGSRKNIYAHYDLGNGFYSQWLDETMTYSSAVFDGDHDLAQAQTRKYQELAKLIDLQNGQKVLEIGCGWGGFAQYAAQNFDAHVTCLTISQAQYEFAKNRMAALGLSDKVEVLLMDYRDIEGEFDAIVSIEMFEAVGEIYWATYFDKVKNCLKKGGKAGLQIITIRDDLFDIYRKRADFIQKYVFPGGMLPSVQKLFEHANLAGLKMQTHREFGLDYAKTLKHWTQRFEQAWNEGRIKGFDNGFRKLWLFYLSYCAAGFDTRRTDVVHLQLENV